MLAQYRSVRKLTEALASPLTDADATVQSMPDASPAKWHLAHTSWFFETFILRDHVAGYTYFNDDFAYLFNSYYEAEGERHARPSRGMITRPSLDEVVEYRAHVDTAVESFFETLSKDAMELVILGINHEQQHQELLLTDIKHMFFQNPLRPAIWPASEKAGHANIPEINWLAGLDGLQEIGDDGAGFAFDCETPRHQVMQQAYEIASRTVTNGEWLQFMKDGGYNEARHWLSDGWGWVQEKQIRAPLYWQQGDDGGWSVFGFGGMQPLYPSLPAMHVSLFEADAYASWYGEKHGRAVRLPTEAEWEAMAQTRDPASGKQLDDAGPVLPEAAGDELSDIFGNVWEWTGSAYRPYPGFRAASGAVGEYNGKFMSGQFVLRGGSCATPRGHIRASYRNFFYPHQRWQFTGVRLARDV